MASSRRLPSFFRAHRPPTALGLGVLLGLLGAALAAPSGCVLNVAGSEISGGGPPCATSAECDDGNPCTADTCTAGSCTFANDNGAVPSDGNDCTADTCVQGTAQHTAQSGPCGAGGMLQCNAQGECAGCMSADETGVDCGGASCLLCGGQPCNADGECQSGACDDNVCASCTDGVLNADEVNVDCGGGSCAGCADGQSCQDGADCGSTFCVDGVCCVGVCMGSCRSCGLPGLEGTCADLPASVEDTNPPCNNDMVCDGNGSCVPDQNKGHYGESCSGAGDCFNNICDFGNCRLKEGDPCADNNECQNENCINDVCGP